MADTPFFTDIKLTRRSLDQLVSDREGVDYIQSSRGDIATIDGKENLVQAIINRLLTRKGELKSLGHPNYGSRVYLLVGELNNIRTRGLAEIYIREALAQDPRIEEIIELQFQAQSRNEKRHELNIFIIIKPVGSDTIINITFPLNLQG